MPSRPIIINLYVLEDRLVHLIPRRHRLILDRFEWVYVSEFVQLTPFEELR